jgi:hypothetical protein
MPKKILRIHGRPPVPITEERKMKLNVLREQAHAKARARRVAGDAPLIERQQIRVPVVAPYEHITCYQTGCDKTVNDPCFRYCRECRC